MNAPSIVTAALVSSVNCVVALCAVDAKPTVGRQPRSPAMRPAAGCTRPIMAVAGNSVVAIALVAFFFYFSVD